MENPDKVRNLVEGSYSELTDLYFPLLLEMQTEEKPAVKVLNDGKIITSCQIIKTQVEQDNNI